MELIRKNIHMNKLICKSNTQLTLDDDFNVPDVKPDIDKIFKEQGSITLLEVKPVSGKLMIKGELNFTLLYVSSDDSRPIHNIVGKLPFDEVINMDDACSEHNVNVKWELEDLSANLINSRKISVKSIVGFTCCAENVYDEEAAVGVEADEHTHFQNKSIDITQVAVNKKDQYRIKDEIILPSGKQNIYEILYYELELRNVETRLSDGKIAINGDVLVFLLYATDSEEQPIQYYETEVPFSGAIDCVGCTESMISDICITVGNRSLEAKVDADKEERVLDFEMVLELDIRAYQEEQIELLRDVYSTAKHVIPVCEEVVFENIVMKNNSKARIVDHISVDSTIPKVLQICNASGTIRIDDTSILANGIQVDGIIDVHLLYIAEEDQKPIGCVKGSIPFSQVVEVKNINNSCNYDIKSSIEQLSVIMVDSQDIEVKVSINLDTIVFDKIKVQVIRNVEEEELDTKVLQEMPSIIGYVVKSEDTLWNIAKKYYTTIENIMDLNNLEDEKIHVGERLLLLKEVDAITIE